MTKRTIIDMAPAPSTLTKHQERYECEPLAGAFFKQGEALKEAQIEIPPDTREWQRLIEKIREEIFKGFPRKSP